MSVFEVSKSGQRKVNNSEVVPTVQSLLANQARHRIAALLRFGMNVKGCVWAARGALWR
jgi:hypothetical protein